MSNLKTPASSKTLESKQRRLVEALQEVAANQGPNVTLARFAQEAGLSPSAVYRWFGNWKKLRVAAGLPERVNLRESYSRYTREELLEAMRATLAEQGDGLSQTTFGRLTGISPGPILRLFGGWGGLRTAVGLDPRTPTTSLPLYSWEELVDALVETANRRGDMTLPMFCAELGISRQVIQTHGSWRDLREAAHLPRRYKPNRPKWLADLIAEIPDPGDLIED